MSTFSAMFRPKIDCLRPAARHRAVFIEMLKSLHPKTCASITEYRGTKLSHPIIARFSDTNPGQIRYEVLMQKPLGTGAFGSVHATAATIEIHGDDELEIKKHKKRAVKIITPASDDLNEYFTTQEATLSLRTTHLHAKKFAQYQDAPNKKFTALTMQMMTGCSLKKYLQANPLSTLDRLNLCIALLKAYCEQIESQKIVHRDIKPDNIMLEVNQGVYVFKFIDLGLALEYESQDNLMVGTPQFFPPENGSLITEHNKYDIYSLGLVMAEIWNATLGAEFKGCNIDAITAIKSTPGYKPVLTNLFHNTDLPSEPAIRESLRCLIQLLTDTTPAKRLTSNKSIEVLAGLRNNYLRDYQPNSTPCVSKAQEFHSGTSDLNYLSPKNVNAYVETLEKIIDDLDDHTESLTTFAALAELSIPASACRSKSAMKKYVREQTHDYSSLYEKMKRIHDTSFLKMEDTTVLLESRKIPDIFTSQLGKSKILSTLKCMDNGAVSEKLLKKCNKKVTLATIKDTTDSFKRALKRYDTVANRILIQIGREDQASEQARFKNAVRLAVLHYINDTTSERNIFKHDRAYSVRREKDMTVILDMLDKIDSVDSMRGAKQQIKLYVNDIKTGFFGRSLLRDNIYDAIDGKYHSSVDKIQSRAC